MASMNYYEILGVEPDCSAADIRKSFRQLAGEFHPDRFSGMDRERAEKRFQSITEAFNVLRSQASREQYDSELSPSREKNVQVMSREEIARKYSAKGAQLYRQGDLNGAREALQRAIDHDPQQAKAHFFLGQILMKLPGKARDGVRRLEEASRLEPQNLIMKTELASAYAGIRLFSRAERLASEILGFDPGNERIVRLLASIETARNDV